MGKEGVSLALICFFRSSKAFSNLAFSGVMVGTFGVLTFEFIRGLGLIAEPELEVGRPPLV